MRHKNIPIFIPHLGCPNMCVFCNQKTISGHDKFDKSSVYGIIENALKTVDPINDHVEIAFFGGSFTGIDREDMLYLLKAAKKYVDAGYVKSIRLSTRPDYISSEILDILKENSVTDIELGVQSMCDDVLCLSKRGHSSFQTAAACQMIKEYGFNLVGQMMLGLPGSTGDKELFTVRELISFGVDAVRIYPTVVFSFTELGEMLNRGDYIALSVDEAADRAADILIILDKHNIPCIRCGLQSQDNFSDNANVIAGAYHPSFGSIALGRVMRKKIEDSIKESGIVLTELFEPTYGRQKPRIVKVYSSPSKIGDVMGYKKENSIYFYNKYNIKIVPAKDDLLYGYNCRTEEFKR